MMNCDEPPKIANGTNTAVQIPPHGGHLFNSHLLPPSDWVGENPPLLLLDHSTLCGLDGTLEVLLLVDYPLFLHIPC